MTSSFCIALQSLVLRVPAVRRALGIPERPANPNIKSASLMDTARYIREWWAKKKQEAIMENRMKAQQRR